MTPAGCARVASFSGVLLGVLLLSFCLPATMAAGVAQEIAKAPTPSDSAFERPPREASAVTPPATERRAVEVAALDNPAPPVGSAADMVEIAHEYGWNWDPDRKKAQLRAAADAFRGMSDAAMALLELARTHAEKGEQAQADAVFAEVAAGYPDAEVQTFVTVMKRLCQALVARDYVKAEALLVDTAEGSSGTELGAWAALQLGNLHRDYTLDWGRAVAYCEAAMAAYPDTLVEEEARLSIAEAVAWEMKRPAEAAELFRSALEKTTNPRLIARGTVGLSFPLSMMGEYTEAYDLLTEFIEQYPDHPGVPLAKAYRCYAAGKLGWWETAEADAEAFLAAPIGRYGHPWAHNSENTLGQCAFQRDDFPEAQRHFERALAVAPDPDATAQSAAGIGHCQAAAGDLEAAVESFLSAAAAATGERAQCMYLHQAAMAAEQAGDFAAFNRIAATLVEQFPGSHLATGLVGEELLPEPEI